MSLRRWREILGPPLLTAAAAAVLVAPAAAEPARSRAALPVTSGAASEPPGLPDCRPGGPAIALRGAAAEPAAWYRLDPVIDGAGGLDGQRLIVGRVGRPGVFELPLAVESFASGPVGGRILVGNDDGRRSTLTIVDSGSRCASVAHEGRGLVRRAVLDPSEDSLVEFRLDRRTRSDLGVWSRPLDGTKPVRLLEPLPANDRIGRVFATELSWSTDGTRLVVTSCGEASCLARILDRASGRIATIDDPRVGEVLGLVDDDLIAYGGCPTLPCEIVARDLRTGRIRVLAELAGLAAVSVADGRTAVVFEDYLADGRLRVVDLSGFALRTLPVDDGLRLVPASSRALAGVELRAGVIALAAGGRPTSAAAPAVFIDIADGRRVPAEEVVR